MRTIHRIGTGRMLRRRGLESRAVSMLATGNDTSLDHYERTVSRAEVAIVADGLMAVLAIYVLRSERTGSRARTTSRKWSRPGAGR